MFRQVRPLSDLVLVCLRCCIFLTVIVHSLFIFQTTRTIRTAIRRRNMSGATHDEHVKEVANWKKYSLGKLHSLHQELWVIWSFMDAILSENCFGIYKESINTSYLSFTSLINQQQPQACSDFPLCSRWSMSALSLLMATTSPPPTPSPTWRKETRNSLGLAPTAHSLIRSAGRSARLRKPLLRTTRLLAWFSMYVAFALPINYISWRPNFCTHFIEVQIKCVWLVVS